MAEPPRTPVPYYYSDHGRRAGRPAPRADHTYVAIFEIDDLDVPLSELVVQALAELPAMVAEAGGALAGDITWTVCADKLVCTAPTRRLEFAPLSTVDEVAVHLAVRGDDRVLEALTDDERAEVARGLLARGVGVKPIARRLCMSEKVVRALRPATTVPRRDAVA